MTMQAWSPDPGGANYGITIFPPYIYKLENHLEERSSCIS